jgi:hypothetical protein
VIGEFLFQRIEHARVEGNGLPMGVSRSPMTS